MLGHPIARVAELLDGLRQPDCLAKRFGGCAALSQDGLVNDAECDFICQNVVGPLS